ncbi:MAG: hypothetical protein QG641_2144 [Candidatus Poribacteria bacterium]|nr:hypothetical protein [Candidatus Poribacteria bacterium]
MMSYLVLSSIKFLELKWLLTKEVFSELILKRRKEDDVCLFRTC